MKFKKFYFCCIVFLTLIIMPCFTMVFSETAEYTIEQILLLTKLNCSDDLAIAKLEFDAGQEDVKIARSEALPQINFATGVGYAAQSVASESYSSTAPFNELKKIYGTMLNWSFSLDQPLITFGRVANALKIAKVRDSQLDTDLSLKKETFYLNVINAFNLAFQSQEGLLTAQRTLLHAEKYYAKTLIAISMGNAKKIDSLKVVAKLAKAKSGLIKSKVLYRSNIRKLATLTEIAMPKGTKLIYSEKGWLSQLDTITISTENLYIKMKQSEVDMRHYQIDYERGKLLPSIYFNAGLSNSFMVFDTGRFLDQFSDATKSFLSSSGSTNIFEGLPEGKDYFNPEYFSFSVGAQLKWNIFDGRRSISNFRKTKLLYEKSERELKILREKSKIEIKEAYDLYNAIEESYSAAIVELEALQFAYLSLKDDLENGYVDYLTYLDMETNLALAEQQVAALQMQKILAVSHFRIASGIHIIKE